MVKKTSPSKKKVPTKVSVKQPVKKINVKKTASKKAVPKKGVSKTKSSPAVAAKKKAVAAVKNTSTKKPQQLQEWLRDKVIAALDDGKAENVLCVDVTGQSTLADYLIVASGRSTRQVKSLADNVQKALYQAGVKQVRMEGALQSDWIVVDGGDIIVHLFRPEVRSYYRLEEVWGLEPPLQQTFKDL
jgi:ribosome-associated protein